MNALRQEEGFTLTELVVAIALLLVAMSGSFAVLDQFTALSRRTDRAADLQDSARAVSRQLSRELRNLAASPDKPGVVERAGPYDLIFRTVDKPRTDGAENALNLHRVRYCLDDNGRDAGRLVQQTQRWSSAISDRVPGAVGCPGGGWDETRFVASRITNRAGTQERPLWTYGQTASGLISSVKLNLFMNEQPKVRAREVALQTGVFLRNQNLAPAATFSATVVGLRHILLNGSGSSDPEGDPLDYYWYVEGVRVGRGLVFDYRAPANGRYSVQLEVFDPSGLSHLSAAQTVVVG
jgi:prepilin-type N-terminal cleavage/methylation domain-containing protein